MATEVEVPGAIAGPTVADEARPSAPLTTSGLKYRSDIDGLRAVAVLLVVLYHAGVPFFSGGYVGVDVFFVISGFLITSGLVAQSEAGRPSLLGFYAGRARRLLPLSMLALTVTVLLGLWLLPAVRANNLLDDARSALLYSANWHYADKSVAYVDTQAADGMLTHFWSLSVEEQFYFVWPLLILLAVFFVRRAPRFELRAVVGVLAATVTGVSLWLSLQLTSNEGSRAYYLSHLRLWEISAGALVAVTTRATWPRRRVGTPVQAIAILAIVFASIRFDERTPFPGSAALIPVLATVVLIGFGGRGSMIDRGLSTPPMRYVGERSYALYLWHWPALAVAELLALRYGWERFHSLRVIVALGVALLLAIVSHRLVEEPVRHSRRLKSKTVASLAAGLCAMMALVGVIGPLKAGNLAAAEQGWADSPVTPSEAEADSAAAEFASCSEAMSAKFERVDWCVGGDPNGKVTIALVGDSHAQHWAPAIDEAGKRNGWRILTSVRSACLVYDVAIYNARLEHVDDNCRSWGRAVTESLAALDSLDMVVIGRARYVELLRAPDGSTPTEAGAADLYDAAVRAFLQQVESSTDRVVVLADTPRARFNVPECLLASSPANAASCDFAATTVAGEQLQVAIEETAVAATPSQHDDVRSFNDLACPAGTCRALLPDGTITFRDAHHLTARYSRALGPALGEQLTDVLTSPD